MVNNTWKDEETAEENRHSLRIMYAGSKLYGKVLDVGCNSGFLNSYLNNNAMVTGYWGIDGSETLIEQARKRYNNMIYYESIVKKEGRKICYTPQFYCRDFSNGLNIKDEWFDSAFMGEVLEHLKQPEPVLASIYRALKPGGLFILTTPLKMEAVNAMLKGIARVHGDNVDHVNEYTTEQLIKLCRRAGFKETGYQLVSQNNKRWFRLIQVLELNKPK